MPHQEHGPGEPPYGFKAKNKKSLMNHFSRCVPYNLPDNFLPVSKALWAGRNRFEHGIKY